MNGMAKVVVWSTLIDPEWNNATVRGDLVEGVRALKAATGGRFIVNGSAWLAPRFP